MAMQLEMVFKASTTALQKYKCDSLDEQCIVRKKKHLDQELKLHKP